MIVPMVASITASIELAALQTENVRYIGQDEILERGLPVFSGDVRL
jgi:hypothetical protein